MRRTPNLWEQQHLDDREQRGKIFPSISIPYRPQRHTMTEVKPVYKARGNVHVLICCSFFRTSFCLSRMTVKTINAAQAAPVNHQKRAT